MKQIIIFVSIVTPDYVEMKNLVKKWQKQVSDLINKTEVSISEYKKFCFKNNFRTIINKDCKCNLYLSLYINFKLLIFLLILLGISCKWVTIVLKF